MKPRRVTGISNEKAKNMVSGLGLPPDARHPGHGGKQGPPYWHYFAKMTKANAQFEYHSLKQQQNHRAGYSAERDLIYRMDLDDRRGQGNHPDSGSEESA